MVLLSSMFRTAAITGRTDTINASGSPIVKAGAGPSRRFVPHSRTSRHPRPRIATRPTALRQLTELHRAGVVTDAELDELRARLRV